NDRPSRPMSEGRVWEGNRRCPSQRLSAHGALHGLLLLRGEGDGGAAAVELLHVDAGVVTALDGRDHDAGAAAVEEGERGGLVAAGVLVGVVADDRRVRDDAVDAPVDARQARGDLVDRAVQVVDPALERDGEVEQVLAAAAEQRALGVPDASHAQGRPPGHDQPDQPDGDAGDAEDGCGRGREGHLALHRPAVHQPREKMTGYVAELFETFASCGTEATSTLMLVFCANGTCSAIGNVSVTSW